MADRMVRPPGWRTRLHKAIGGHKRAAFEWGAHDCAILAADAVLAQTGTDPAADWRGKYRTLAGGIRVLKRATGCADHVALAAKMFPEIAPAQAQFGDLAVLASPFGPALGIVQGAVILGYVTPPGAPIEDAVIAPVPFEAATRAFRVE